MLSLQLFRICLSHFTKFLKCRVLKNTLFEVFWGHCGCKFTGWICVFTNICCQHLEQIRRARTGYLQYSEPHKNQICCCGVFLFAEDCQLSRRPLNVAQDTHCQKKRKRNWCSQATSKCGQCRWLSNASS